MGESLDTRCCLPRWVLAEKREGRVTYPQPSLYERVGGAVAVSALVNQFYERVLRDEQLAPFFANADLQKLRAMQCEFFSVAP